MERYAERLCTLPMCTGGRRFRVLSKRNKIFLRGTLTQGAFEAESRTAAAFLPGRTRIIGDSICEL